MQFQGFSVNYFESSFSASKRVVPPPGTRDFSLPSKVRRVHVSRKMLLTGVWGRNTRGSEKAVSQSEGE